MSMRAWSSVPRAAYYLYSVTASEELEHCPKTVLQRKRL